MYVDDILIFSDRLFYMQKSCIIYGIIVNDSIYLIYIDKASMYDIKIVQLLLKSILIHTQKNNSFSGL